MDLKTSLSSLPGIGPGTIWKLKKLAIETVENLITHYPFRYDDFSNIKPAIEAQVGEVVTLQGEIWSIKNIFTRSRKVLTQAIFNDGTSPLTLTWFNQGWLTKQIIVGDRLQISGKLGKYKNKLSMMAPRWEKLETLGLHLKGVASIFTGNLTDLVEELKGEGYKHILVEGGPTLLGSFLKEGLIDEIFLTIAPKIFGSKPGSTKTLIEGILLPSNKFKLKLISVKKIKDELFLRYTVRP